MEPEVLVLDEPSAGLDPQGREELLSNIREFHRARGTTVVLVSHSMEEIAKNVDRIVVLSDSHVLMSGTPREDDRGPRRAAGHARRDGAAR